MAGEVPVTASRGVVFEEHERPAGSLGFHDYHILGGVFFTGEFPEQAPCSRSECALADYVVPFPGFHEVPDKFALVFRRGAYTCRRGHVTFYDIMEPGLA